MNEPIIVHVDDDLDLDASMAEKLITEHMGDCPPVVIINHRGLAEMTLTNQIASILGSKELHDDMLLVGGNESTEKRAIHYLNDMVLKYDDMICAPEKVEPYVGWDRVKDWKQRERQRQRRNKRR